MILAAVRVQGSEGRLLLLHLSYTYDPTGGAELFVVAVGLFHFHVEVLEQGQTHVHLHRNVLGQPDFIVHPRLLEHNARSLVDARQEPSQGNRVNAFDVQLRQLGFILVDPHPTAELGQELRFFHVRLVSRPRLGVDHPRVAFSQTLCPNQVKVVGIRHLTHELAAVFAILLFFPRALSARVFGFVLPLVHDLLDFLFFFFRVLGIEGLAVFLDQPLHLLAVKLHHFIGLYVDRLHIALAIEVALLVALRVGVVAQPFVVLDVLLGGHAKQLLHLLLRQSSVGIGREIGQGSDGWRLGRGRLILPRRHRKLSQQNERQNERSETQLSHARHYVLRGPGVPSG